MERVRQTVLTADGVRIELALYQEKGRSAVVMICPGFFQSKETPTFQQMSQALGRKYDVLAMDFRGHGRSTGLYTFSSKEGEDLQATLAFARERYQRIGLLGFSMGGAIAINTIRRHPDAIQSLITISAPCAVDEIAVKWWSAQAMRTGIQGLEVGAGCRPGNVLLAKERPIDTVRHLTLIPKLFLHGTNDAIVDAEHSRRLHGAAPEPKRLEMIESDSHAEALFRDDPTRFIGIVHEWFAPSLNLKPDAEQ